MTRVAHRILPLVLVCWNLCLLAQDGSLDFSFDPGTGANSTIQSISLQPDGKIIIGGYFTNFNGYERNYIARLNSDGTVDTSFEVGAGTNGPIFCIARQLDGKILIAGAFDTYDNTSRHNIARLNVDGSLDISFDPGAGPNSFVNSTDIQPDGKVLIGGEFTSYDGILRNRIARLNINGSLDNGFNPELAPSAPVLSTVVLSNAGIIVSGGFSGSIGLLNADGSLNNTFNSGTGVSGTIWPTAGQVDGKILIGGYFYGYDGVPRNSLARLNIDGSLDLSFDPLSGTTGTIFSITTTIDGRILVGGAFGSFNGTPRNGIARINSDGSLDSGFDPGAGADALIRATVLQSDGKILIGGEFTSFAGTARNGIARLNNAPVGIQEAEAPQTAVFPNPSQGCISITTSMAGLLAITVSDISGRVVLKDQVQPLNSRPLLIRLEDQTPGTYLVSLTGKQGTVTERIIVQ